MPIEGIATIGAVGLEKVTGLAAGVPGGVSGANEAAESFGRLLGQALDNLNRVQVEADASSARLAAGEPVDLHDVMLAVEEADLSLRLALQMRNKLMEAYQEINRMQV
ncbi:MAG: flagellar hook-basal body complex protein FliE [Chloroflexi bacterium RBG_16_57_9]|nr:MAG: flagellar hook-basal body complex protein FliE [Chloroflexi bacterium RBG_16_57_9]